MNIFYLHNDPVICAEMHNDKHCIKMILEYCQLLSTAHRVLDGKETIEKKMVTGSLPVRWRNVKRWVLDSDRNDMMYSATHMNHPSAIWCRANLENYLWLHSLLVALCTEYTHRYGKIHKCQRIGLVDALSIPPDNVPSGEFTEPTPAMPKELIVRDDSVTSYRNYYINNKVHLASWKGKVNSRNQPEWFNNAKL